MKHNKPITSKYLCNYCNIFVQDNALQRKKHEDTDGHKKKRQQRIDQALSTKWQGIGERSEKSNKSEPKQVISVDIDPLTGMGEWQSYEPEDIVVPIAASMQQDPSKTKIKITKHTSTSNEPIAFKKRLRKRK